MTGDRRMLGRWPGAAAALGACLSVVGAVVIVMVGPDDPARGAVVSVGLSGVAGAVSGASVGVWFLHSRRPLSGERARLLLGLALFLWGLGQIVLAAGMTPDGRRAFGAGDVISSCAVPVMLGAVASLPRRSRTSRPTLRILLDALIITMTVTLALWWAWVQPGMADPWNPGGGAWSGIVGVIFDVGSTAVVLMAWVRDRYRGGLLVVLGLALQAVADVGTIRFVVAGAPVPWQSGPVWCLGMPLIAAGVIRFGAVRPARGVETTLEDIGESRASMVSTSLSLVILSTVTAAYLPERRTLLGSLLAGSVIALLVAREIVNGRIRNRMLHWLNEDALRDVLTGLPNRSALTARLRALDLCEPWALLTVDLDDFKEVNDQLGPDASDELIIQVAAALGSCCPARGLVARIGGDEFAVLAPGTVEDGERVAEELGAAVRGVGARHEGVALTASVGVGRVLADDDAPQEASASATAAVPAAAEHRDRMSALLESAAALRAAKAAGRGRIAPYPGAVEQARLRRLVLERRLRSAIDVDGLEMHAQPLVNLRTGRVAGFESLARWTDEVLGRVPPDEFVPVAEQTGMVNALGEFALRSTLVQAIAGGVVDRGVEIGVNVSPIQLRYATFAPMVVDLVSELGLDPRQLLLEVTEAILVDEDDPASGALARLARAGVRLAIDDFGTGYSALGYLRRIPLNVLKVDRSWVVASVTDPRTRDIVRGVVALSHSLGVTVVMEGIEDDATAQMCRDVDADLGQGWLFGRPKPWPVAAAELAVAPLRRPPEPRESLVRE